MTDCTPSGPTVPPGWTCSPDFYGDAACDCGCGATDTDCGSSPSCTAPGPCDRTGCDYCYDSDGAPISCSAPVWTCPAEWYGDGICDCGCGSEDSDCGGPSCTAPGPCPTGACDVCSDASGNPVDCTGNWSCDPTWFGDTWCDCGCDATDIDCGSGPSCSAPGGCPNSVCDYCLGPSGPIDCAWSCDPSWFGDGYCDCGCGAEDSDCGGAPVCTAPGPCGEAACEYCSDGWGGNVSCGNEWLCDPAYYGDGYCDCGCGAEDSDCAGLWACTEPDCVAWDCEYCWDSYGYEFACY